MSDEQPRTWFHALRDRLAYIASLPERSVRSLAAVAGGTTTLLTETLFPEALRGSTVYRIFIGDTQKFIIEKVAQIEQEAQNVEQASDPAYMQRKMIGGAFETAGLFAMHISPLWVFAVLGDAASGGNVFLQRLVIQLKANKVIDPDANIDNLTDVLEAMQNASSGSATAIDTPPLSREELNTLVTDMRTRYGKVFSSTTNLLPRLDTLWQQMNDVARKENVSLEKLMGVLTIDIASVGRRGFSAALAVGQTGFGLIDEHLLDGYAETLKSIRTQGFTPFIEDRLAPFLDSASSHFDPRRTTWTESLFGCKPTPEPAVPPALPVEIQTPEEKDVHASDDEGDTP